MKASVRKSRFSSRQKFGLLLIAPSFIIILGLMLYPLLYSLGISFFNLHITAPWLGTTFVGLKNYLSVITDPDMHSALEHTLILAAVGIGLGIPISLLFAIILNRKFPLRGLVRGILIIPWVIPGSVQGLLWSRIFDPHYGALNGILIQWGIITDPVAWLLDPTRALLFIAFASLWGAVPMMSLLYLSGLQSIPEELFDASRVDGASFWGYIRYIVIPLLLPITLINLVLRTIDAFTMFDLVYVLTGGGPAGATQVTGYYLYQAAFTKLNYGYASALAWLIAITVTLLAIFYSRFTLKEETAS
ncbi:MAG TPA: ABC transporter permease [Anaerolineaceae bacterium]|jgi:ABC-type sugar transport system permease subunit|nr:ABC transporter permease [Anaerolineaceae bacterium]